MPQIRRNQLNYIITSRLFSPETWKNVVDSIDCFFFLKKRLPFDWRTPFGYLIALFIECMAVFSIIQTTIPLTCFFIGSCWILAAFAKDITSDLSGWNVGRLLGQRPAIDKMRLCHIVQIHSDTKQLSVEKTFNSSILLETKKKITIIFHSDSLVHSIKSMNSWYQAYFCGFCRIFSSYISWYILITESKHIFRLLLLLNIYNFS